MPKAVTFSPIQNHIISKLKNASSRRYSELQPDRTPNDLFNYHLQHLVKKGFIVKKGDEGYALSETGVKHVADPLLATDQLAIASLFKVNVITIASRVRDGKIEILNQVRKSNPSYGKVGVMGGIVRKGEPILAAAKRKFKIETGLDADFRLLGIERRFLYKDGELFSDVYFPISYSDSCAGTLEEDTDYGHNMWVSIDEAIKNDAPKYDSIVQISEVLKAIKAGKVKKMPFFFVENEQK